MFGRVTWLRRLGGLLVACLVLMLAGAPTFDEFVCVNDTAVAEASASDGSISVARPDVGGAAHLPDADDLCAHGHCHHGAPFLVSAASLTTHVHTAPQLRPRDMAALASRSPAGLERPPRV